jgi:hypothetical protein
VMATSLNIITWSLLQSYQVTLLTTAKIKGCIWGYVATLIMSFV